MPKLTKTALRRKQPVTDEVLIPADDEQRRKLTDANAALENAEQGLGLAQITGQADDLTSAGLRVEEARLKLEAVKDEVRKTGVCFTLVGVGRDRWDEIILANPPTEEQKKEAEEKKTDPPLYDPDTFWPALLAACVPDSDLTAEDWRKEVFESKNWGPSEVKELRDRARIVNLSSRILQLGN